MVVLALLEPQDPGIELEGLVLIVHDDGHVGCFLDHFVELLFLPACLLSLKPANGSEYLAEDVGLD